ncbi:MAG: EthD domain-containing protein [Frankiaceae bacterium]
MITTILGYDIVPGVSAEEYERWLFEVHAPDLLANPHLDRIVFNKVLRPVRQASGGTASIPEGSTYYRIAEMHYADEAAYQAYLDWFIEHPLAAERGPGGRTDFRFYLVTESTEVTRDNMAEHAARVTE